MQQINVVITSKQQRTGMLKREMLQTRDPVTCAADVAELQAGASRFGYESAPGARYKKAWKCVLGAAEAALDGLPKKQAKPVLRMLAELKTSWFASNAVAQQPGVLLAFVTHSAGPELRSQLDADLTGAAAAAAKPARPKRKEATAPGGPSGNVAAAGRPKMATASQTGGGDVGTEQVLEQDVRGSGRKKRVVVGGYAALLEDGANAGME